MKQPPFTYLAGLGNWSLFCGLSYRGGAPSPARCERDLVNWLLWVANKSRVKPEKLVYLARPENGERFGRIHGHALIELSEQVLRRFFLLQKGICESIKMGSKYIPAAHKAWGHGMTFFRLVQGASDPVVTGYLDKQDKHRAESYEINKTAAATRLVISKALHRRAMSALKRVTISTGTEKPAATALAQFNGSSLMT